MTLVFTLVFLLKAIIEIVSVLIVVIDAPFVILHLFCNAIMDINGKLLLQLIKLSERL